MHAITYSILPGGCVIESFPRESEPIKKVHKPSPVRAIGFFLLHSVCALGGVALAGGAATLAYIGLLAKMNLENHNQPEKIKEMKKGIRIATAVSVGGCALTMYGLQGLYKDFKNLIN